MLFAGIGLLDEWGQYRENQFLGVRGKKIEYIGAEPPEEDYGERYDGQGKLLMPGLVNAHSHAAMTLLRGYAENLALDDWLNTRVFPFEALLTPEDIYNGSMLAIAELLRFGVTSVTDMYFGEDAVCRAALESGIKINFSSSITCFDESDLKNLPAYRETLPLIREFHNADDGRIRIDLAIHAEYTSTPKTVAQMADWARETGLRMHLHLSETRSEHEACKARHNGKTPAQYFDSLGVFDAPATAAHCVWAEDRDIEIFKARGVTVACNPVSNLKLASGFCPVPRLLGAGINVALGTDGAASNNSLNLLEEARLFATLYKAASGDPTAVSPAQAVYAATRAGAHSQGREDCGILREGARADLAVFDLRGRPYYHPCHDMAGNLIYAGQGADVCLTMVDGKILYRDGAYTTIDLEKAIRETEQSAYRIAGALRKEHSR
ncbi:MAG: amidohydrolase [Anaerotruncus sp.]|jgi:5-methylthioadenosine/S-adenosylhomocysteine deaminase|nr:amidohydrolase [Anaerotruncus sp.]